MFKFGIIGAGKIAHKFCDAVRLIEGACVAAVSSKSLDRAREFAQAEEISYYSDSYEKMLTDNKLDAVYIATTHNFHYENALLCLSHNCPVLIEKAMVTNSAHAKEIFRLAKEKKLFVMEAMWSRFLPHINKAREWILNGEIGKLNSATFAIGFKANPDPGERYFSREFGGGAVYDIGVYVFELLTYLVNQQVEEISVLTVPAVTGVDLSDNISVRFESCIANLQISFAAGIPANNVICGTTGYISIPNIVGGSECFLYKNGEVKEHFKEEFKNGFVFEIQETIRCVNAGLYESPTVPHKDTIQCCKMFDIVNANLNKKSIRSDEY